MPGATSFISFRVDIQETWSHVLVCMRLSPFLHKQLRRQAASKWRMWVHV